VRGAIARPSGAGRGRAGADPWICSGTRVNLPSFLAFFLPATAVREVPSRLVPEPLPACPGLAAAGPART